MIWTLVQLLALGFALGIGQKFALWALADWRQWRDRCVSCGFMWSAAGLFGRPCRMCREARR